MKIAAGILLLFLGVSGGFCEKYVLSVDDAVNLARKNNVSIARSQITLEAARRNKNHSWNSVSPSITLGASSTIPMDSLTSGDQESKYTASLGISATVQLSLTANLYTQIQAAKINYEQQKISFEDAVRAIELSVRQSYYGLLYEKENINLQQQNLNMAMRQYERNSERYNSGRLSEIDALSAEVNYKSKIPTVESAVTTYINDLSLFKQVLGLMLDDEVELEGSLDDVINLNEIKIDEKNIKSSSIAALQQKIENARNSVLDKRFSAFAPNLSARLNWQDQSWYVGYDGEAPDAKKTSSVTLSATIPLDGILPWTSRNDAIDSAKDTLKDLELQLDNLMKEQKRSIDSSLRSIKQSQEAIKYKQANVELANKTYEMTLEAYNKGAKDLLTLQNSNVTLLNAQVSLKNEIYTLAKSIMNLENTIGVPFGTFGVNK